jgi:FAD:protein FMN transferase
MMGGMRLLAHLVLIGLLAITIGGCDGPDVVILDGPTMGTTYRIKVVTHQKIDEQGLHQQIDEVLERVNQEMSTYIPDSELSRFNRSLPGQQVHVPGSLIDVLEMSGRIHRLSDGAFDVTVGPLVNLWGFGPEVVPYQVPTDRDIAEARRQVGMDRLVIGEGSLIKKADLYVDLSSIAKGYAADEVSQLLESGGLGNHLVEIGGELKGRGTNERGKAWVIAVEKPIDVGRAIHDTLPLANMGMATSGDYRNFRELDGVRYSHTIDPRTGRPITHDLASVTVLHESAALADGFATAIDVLGPEAGMLLAESQDLPVLFIIKSGDGFEERRSASLIDYLAQFERGSE